MPAVSDVLCAHPALGALANPEGFEIALRHLPTEVRQALEHANRVIDDHWHPIGIAEPLLSVVQDEMTEGMIWLPDLLYEQLQVRP
jgi:hypothetical protein